MEQLHKMMCAFQQSTEKMGLKIRPRKTKILSNQSSSRRTEMEIGNIEVEILTKEECINYLGQMVTFQQQDTTEIKNRIKAVWATFYKNKQHMTSKSYFLRHKHRLFDMVISPTMNYASGTCTLKIQSTHRKMLRLIIQTKRQYKMKTQNKNKEKMKEGITKPEKKTMEKKRQKTTEAPKTKLLMVTAQTQVSIKTVTSLS